MNKIKLLIGRKYNMTLGALNDLTYEQICKFHSAFKLTSDMGCPPEEFRVKEKTECFHCNECWIAALENFAEQKIQIKDEF
jgi:hypothetical protein